MKRLPLICSVAAVAALSASLAYWGMQLFKPAQRPIAAAPVAVLPEANMDAARGLFGGAVSAAAVSNYQLRGVVASSLGVRSAAIISADGQPAQAYAVGAEVAPGVTVKEVHARHVILSEGGVPKRLELAVEQPGMGGVVQGEPSLLAPMPGPQPVPPPMQPAPAPVQMAPAEPPSTAAQPSGGVPQTQ